MAMDLAIWQQRLSAEDVAHQLGTRPMMVLTLDDCDVLNAALGDGWLTPQGERKLEVLRDRISRCAVGESELGGRSG